MKDHDETGKGGCWAVWDGPLLDLDALGTFKQTTFVGHRFRTPAGGNVATPGDDCDPPLIVEDKP